MNIYFVSFNGISTILGLFNAEVIFIVSKDMVSTG